MSDYFETGLSLIFSWSGLEVEAFCFSSVEYSSISEILLLPLHDELVFLAGLNWITDLTYSNSMYSTQTQQVFVSIFNSNNKRITVNQYFIHIVVFYT